MNKKYKNISIEELSNYFGVYISILRNLKIKNVNDLLWFNNLNEDMKIELLSARTNNYKELMILINNISNYVINSDETKKSYKEFHNILLTESNFKGILNENILKILYSKGIYRLETLFTESDKEDFITIGDINTKKDVIMSCKLLRAYYLDEFPFTKLDDPIHIFNFFSDKAVLTIKRVIDKENITFDDVMDIIKNNLLNTIEDLDINEEILNEIKVKLQIIYNCFFNKSDKKIIYYENDSSNTIIKNIENIDNLSKDNYSLSYMLLLNKINTLNISDDDKQSLLDEIKSIQESQLKDKKNIVRLNIELKRKEN